MQLSYLLTDPLPFPARLPLLHMQSTSRAIRTYGRLGWNMAATRTTERDLPSTILHFQVRIWPEGRQNISVPVAPKHIPRFWKGLFRYSRCTAGGVGAWGCGSFLAYFPFARQWSRFVESIVLSIHLIPFFQFLNNLTDFHEIWYERYTIGSCPTPYVIILYNISNSNMADAWTCVVRATFNLMPWNNSR